MPSRKIAASHFSKDIRDFLTCLGRHSVDFMIVGGEAVIFHGYPRVTGDVDILYRLTPDNTRRLYAALKDFWGGGVPGIKSSSSLNRDGMIVQFGVPPNRIDLINRMDGVSFEEASDGALTVVLEGMAPPAVCRFIGIDELIRNKIAAGRPKDLDDVRFLKAAAARAKPERPRRRKIRSRRTNR
jgi:hypothetical protein